MRGGRKERKKEREGGKEDAQWKRIRRERERGRELDIIRGRKKLNVSWKISVVALSCFVFYRHLANKKMFLLFKICLTFTLNMVDGRRLNRWKKKHLSRGKFT